MAVQVVLPTERPERKVAESALLFLNAEIAQSLLGRVGLEAAMVELDIMGFTTGVRLTTRLAASRFPITAERSAMKFICKELWAFLFRKPADRLQTDRRGNYIVQDGKFRWLEHLGQPSGGGKEKGDTAHDAELQEAAALHLALPCGIIRGALLAVGLESTVSAEVSASTLPACSFTVTLKTVEDAKVAA